MGNSRNSKNIVPAFLFEKLIRHIDIESIFHETKGYDLCFMRNRENAWFCQARKKHAHQLNWELGTMTSSRGSVCRWQAGVNILPQNHKLFRGHDFEHKKLFQGRASQNWPIPSSKIDFSSDLGHFKSFSVKIMQKFPNYLGMNFKLTIGHIFLTPNWRKLFQKFPKTRNCSGALTSIFERI